MYESNINRVPSGALAETTQSLIGGLTYQERSVNFNAQILAQAERRRYLLNSYNDESIYFVNGAAVWTISPQQFTWTVEDVARQVQLDIAAPDTPSNRTNTNTLSTGPDFTLRLGPVDTVTIAARYARYTIDGPGDTKSYFVQPSWVHRVSELTTLSLNYTATRYINLDPSPFGETRLEQRFLRFETRPSLGMLTIDVGTNSFAQEGGANGSGRLVRLVFLRPLTSESSLRVSFDSQYFVTSTELLAGVTSPAPPTAGAPSAPSTIVATRDTYYSRGGDISYENHSRRFVFALVGSARSIDYQNPLTPDFEESRGRIECTWLSSDTARVRARTEYLRRTFQQDPFRQDHQLYAGVGVIYNLTQNVNISVDAERIAQSSSAPQFDFVDRRAILSLAYNSSSLRR